jgi:hypothetical protein
MAPVVDSHSRTVAPSIDIIREKIQPRKKKPAGPFDPTG